MPLDHMSERREREREREYRRIFEYKWRHTIHFLYLLYDNFSSLYAFVSCSVHANSCWGKSERGNDDETGENDENDLNQFRLFSLS